MLSRLFGPRQSVTVRVLGLAAGRMVHWEGRLRLPAPATVEQVLHAAARSARAGLIAALAAGEQPVILLNGLRLDLPSDLSKPVPDGASLVWLSPMAGG